MTEEITIAPMQEQHVDSIAALERACFSEPWSREAILQELSNDTAHFWVALKKGEVAGYLGMHGVLREGYIANLAVFEQYRQKGVATMLLKQAFAFCTKHDYVFLSLEVRPSNHKAVALYEKMGFQQVGIRKRFYRSPQEDGLILTRFF